ncbi:hypothetical protein F1536_27765 [Achromobacter xylosoxidans]|uniref:hypothetical protein n=1 Tax=Alcaligenaceae TaxID=506 RepID=UPI00123191D8|nr:MULTISPECIES: hypothetical protein [Alcaligenaceae]KAA5919698.1 hypothetical protein F1536_27765 [Achromobacter xylosoxidans]QII87425.1 hypothetical protein G3T20_23640 [Bordetella hinzii]
MSASNHTLTHVYGVAGLLPGIVSIIFLVKSGAAWQEYALVASGWVAAIFYAIMLLRAFDRSRLDGEMVGQLKEQINSLENELRKRSATADFLASLQMGQRALPRAAIEPASNGEDKA